MFVYIDFSSLKKKEILQLLLVDTYVLIVAIFIMQVCYCINDLLQYLALK